MSDDFVGVWNTHDPRTGETTSTIADPAPAWPTESWLDELFQPGDGR